MKKLFAVMVTGCLLTLLLAGSAQAQLPGTVIHASIPFDFIVRGRTLPAGEYEVRRINDEPIDLLIRNVGNKHDKAIFDTESVYVRTTPSKNVLLFHRYGNSYFLSEVLTDGEQTGRELTPSRAERQLRRELAKNQIEPETVAIALY